MLMGFFGMMGDYKTTTMTFFVREAVIRGFPVRSNYTINYPGCVRLELSELLSLDQNKISGMIADDEIYGHAESRISSSKVNRFYSYFVFQSRKLGQDVLYSAQLDSAVDLRVFLLTPIKVACLGLDESGRFIRYKVAVNNHISSALLSLDIVKKYVFPYFDTTEIVDPVGLSDLIIELEKHDSEKINARVDSAVKQVLSYSGLADKSRKYVMKYQIEDWMLRLGIPHSLASFVYNRIKSGESHKKSWWLEHKHGES